MTYQEYLQTEGWRRRKGWALTFWNNKCALCYSPDKVDVHHRTYIRLGAELLTDMIPLCRQCHEHHHGILPEIFTIDISEFIEA